MPLCSVHRLPSVYLPSGQFQSIELKSYNVAYASHREALDRPSLPRVALSSARYAPLPAFATPLSAHSFEGVDTLAEQGTLSPVSCFAFPPKEVLSERN